MPTSDYRGFVSKSGQMIDLVGFAPTHTPIVEALAINTNGWIAANATADFQTIEAYILKPGCYANCDGSTIAPILNVADFSCFLNSFAAGDSFPELRITPDRWAPHRYAGASLDFTPFHLDADLAKAIGLPGIILHGLYTYGQLVRGLLGPFDSDPRALRSLGARFRRPAVPEHELVVSGTVTAAAGDRLEVACAVAQDGPEVISEGIAELTIAH